MTLQVTYKYRQQRDDLGRRREGMEVKRKYPDKVPLAIGRVNRSELPELDKDRFLFPASTTVGDLARFINGQVGRHKEAPLFIYVQNEVVLSSESSMAELYQEHREDDFFLYLAYYEENIHSHLPKGSS